jgi:hypothetical protein
VKTLLIDYHGSEATVTLSTDNQAEPVLIRGLTMIRLTTMVASYGTRRKVELELHRYWPMDEIRQVFPQTVVGTYEDMICQDEIILLKDGSLEPADAILIISRGRVKDRECINHADNAMLSQNPRG